MRLDIGERLREERERLNLSQLALGEIGGVKKLAQLKYEKGERSPDADYLNAIAKVGVDIQYVVTNVRATSALTSEEQQLLSSYRAAPLAVKAAALAALTAGSSASAGSINVTGSGQRVAGRDYHENKK
ncbi:helix-turn-helix transcriptional regulator [Dickeya oryzae]|uniref:Helix-turn-helix transcriptional regulator n=1 Tax=Dickeya oryzae TaxID=1240404 RepID=A0ABS5B7Y9_9GAMM|nr:helix-turn-helix transcriptional regulator [Dickeya oryzae]MBP2856578.1 helix-turn-helix transcriptional regulator [Dickeya oryzae]